MKHYVEYQIPDMTGDKKHLAGPYSYNEVWSHLLDIQGYAGVTDAKVVPADEIDPKEW